MAVGHIRLGTTAATLRDYLLLDPRNYRATSANPMAARVSTGSQYGDLQAWSTFLMADWQAGVGKVASEAGGFLFAEAETRVPQQVILPAALGLAWRRDYDMMYNSWREDVGHMPDQAAAYTAKTIGGTGNPTRIAVKASEYSVTGVTKRISEVWFYGIVPDGVTARVTLYSSSGGAPNAALSASGGTVTGTVTGDPYRPGAAWHRVEFGVNNSYLLNHQGESIFHIVIEPVTTTDEIVIYCGDAYAGTAHTYASSTWTTYSAKPFFLWKHPFTWSNFIPDGHHGISGMFIAEDELYLIGRGLWYTTGQPVAPAVPYVYNATTETFDYTIPSGTWADPYAQTDNALISPATLYDGVIYVPHGAEGHTTYTIATDTVAASAVTAHQFCSWAGYLWRAYNNQLWYSVDGSTWTAISNDVGPSDYKIRGMTGLGQYLYVATDEALYYVAPGDIAVGLFPWSTIDERNGVGMTVHQGALYIPVAGRILRYSEDGSLQDVWVARDDDLNNRRLGEIAALAGLSSWLVAGVNGTTSSDPASVWAFTQQGWHHMATLPPGLSIQYLYYDRQRSRLWIATDTWAIFYIHAPDWALNPYNDSNSTYMPHGWMEIGRVYGGLRELRKDWESVRMFGEFTATGQDVTVYWQDAGTTTWTSLGTATADAQELRWSNYSTRPSGRWLRLGFLLATDDATATPKIEATATKLLPMVTDREAWNLAIGISDNQEMVDGDINPYTADEMIAHLRALVQQVPPFIFEDVDGTQYEVKAQGSARNIQQYEWLAASDEKRIMWVYEISIEQVTSGAYN